MAAPVSPARSVRAGRRRPRRGGEETQDSYLSGHSRALPYTFAAPALATIAVILAVPVLWAMYESLFQAKLFGAEKHFVGLANYRDLLGDDAFWSALRKTGVFVAGSLVLGQTLSIVFGFSLNRAVNSLRFVRSITILPFIVSSVAAAVMFRITFNDRMGLPNRLLGAFGIDGPAWLANDHLAMLVVIVVQVWSDLPLSILIVLGGLQTVDQSHLDAALVDGASGWSRARHVVLPLIAPQIVVSTIWLSFSCFTSLATILAMTGGGPGTATQTLTMEMYSTAFSDLDYHSAMAIAVILLFINAFFSLVILRIGGRFGRG